jgi:MoaA/NifB/PqqE/SkfB family radical SAM enzyme
MANKFCGFLSNGLRVQTDWDRLKVMPCCAYPGAPVYFDDPEFDAKFVKIHNQVSCTGCNYHHEPKNSLRGHARDGAITYLELSIDLECNAACLSCNDSFSSTWAAQNKKFKIKSEHDYPDPQDPRKVVDQLFARYNFSHLKQLLFFGGEPMKAPTTELFLTRLVQEYNIADIELTFVTNASLPPPPAVSALFKQFRKVNMNLSLDGIGEQFEYLRYPLSWQRVVDNISYLRTLDVDQFLVTATINPFNAYYCDRLISWANSYFSGDRLHSVAFSKCTGSMDLYMTPQKLINVLREKYADHPQLARMFNSTTAQNNTKMMEYIAAMDRYRKQSWQQVFPEVCEYFVT